MSKDWPMDVPNAYEALKALTRGNTIDESTIRAFIETLDIPAIDKERLLAMSPASYIGKASELAKGIGQ